MSVIIGQKNLLEKINKTTLDTFPHSVLLVGESGSGKHLICEYISEHLNIEISDITESISFETISDIYLSVEPLIYIIDGSKLTDKKENALLKFVEEPTKNSFIIILCEATQQLLPTIINRCQVCFLEKYTKEDLKKFTDNESILKYASTPGQVIKLTKQRVDDIISLCNNMVDNISKANFSNVLTITDKLALKGEEDKFDLDCFMRCMVDVLFDRMSKENSYDDNQKLFKAFVVTRNLFNETRIHHINLRYLFDNYLISLRYTLM